MITEYQELIKTLADTSTRSGERLNILSGFVKNFPPEKITKLKTLSVEWEDSRMDREHGAKEACEFIKKKDFKRSQVAFDAAFEKQK